MRRVLLIAVLAIAACSADPPARECTIVHNADGTADLVCPDGSRVQVSDGDQDADADIRTTDSAQDSTVETSADTVTGDSGTTDNGLPDVAVDSGQDVGEDVEEDSTDDMAELEDQPGDTEGDTGELDGDHPCYGTTGICVWMRYDAAGIRDDRGRYTVPQDMDLHFMNREVGTYWDRSPEDCHWKNLTPDWGIEGDSSDDPVCIKNDIGDDATEEAIEAWEPEETTLLENPQDGVYSIGVFHFSDHNRGPCPAWVEISLDGGEPSVLEFPAAVPGGFENRQFWWAADLSWPGGEITEVRGHYPSGMP